jgi:hypothetical protein
MRIATLSCIFALVAFTCKLSGQTVTASGGTSGAVPVFTGATTISNSPLTVSGGYVGIENTSPQYFLDIQAGSNGNPLALRINSPSTYDVLNWITPSHVYQASVGGSATGALSNTWFVYDATSSATRFAIAPSGNVGIGTAAPGAGLDVMNGLIHTTGAPNPSTTAQGAYFSWNFTGGTGETDFINNVGLGSGGWWFYNQPSGGSATPVLKISAAGALTFADGTVQSTAWSGTACITGGDYSESVDVTGERGQYEPGDVMTIDPDHPGSFLKATERYSTLIAGVYSTKPGFTGRRQPASKPKDGEVPMAMVGIVPTKVSAENGPIHTGDLLVTSSTPGHAMRGTDRSMLAGAVVGKALGSLDSGTGVIEVLISLQ